jgi:hypothetical protein
MDVTASRPATIQLSISISDSGHALKTADPHVAEKKAYRLYDYKKLPK